MNNTRFLLLLLLSTSCFFYQCQEEAIPCNAAYKTALLDGKIKGMTVVAAQDPIQNTPIIDLNAIHVNWVAALPYAFYVSNNPTIDSISVCPIANCAFGPGTNEAAIRVVQSAHMYQMKAMLKPQLWAENEWVGDLSFDTEAKWDSFEQNYTDYILQWALIAEQNQVELFCIGTELIQFVRHRPNYWRNLIPQIRQIYSGQLTYAANWDDYNQIPFWDLLDFVGVDAYFSLNSDKTPEVCDLLEDWKVIETELFHYSKHQNKAILFTEFGYLSMDGCAYQTWNLENKKATIAMNEQAQANAIQALLETFGPKDWWAGGFQWKWYADAQSAACEEDLSKDYCLEGKMSMNLLKAMYQ